MGDQAGDQRSWGYEIEQFSTTPGIVKQVYKVHRSGCCLPANFCNMCCPGLKRRSYLWINEGSVEENLACFVCLDPFRCKFCTTADYVSKTYFDREPFADQCCGMCKTSFATENDLNYCCFCINCVCLYNICSKPCCGGELVGVPCPRDSTCFCLCTRCVMCRPFLTPIGLCILDSDGMANALTEAVNQAKARKAANLHAGTLATAAPMQQTMITMVTPVTRK